MTKRVKILGKATQETESLRSTQIIKEEIHHLLDRQFLPDCTRKRKLIIEVTPVIKKLSKSNNKRNP
jgi:hypothetical protein